MCACVDPELHVDCRYLAKLLFAWKTNITSDEKRFFVLIAAVAFGNSNDAQTRSLMCTPNALYTQAAGYINVALPYLLTDVCPFTTLYVSTHAIQILNISAAAATTLCGMILITPCSVAQLQLKQNSVAANH